MSASLCQLRKLPDGKWHLALLARREYGITPGTRPILKPQASVPDAEETTGWKPFTDVVFRGDIFPDGRRADESTATFEVDGRFARRVRATGRRVFTGQAGGVPTLSAPERISATPLRYELCYGGFDAHAEARSADASSSIAAQMFDMPLADVSPFTYPRNRRGTGYFVGELPTAAIGTAVPCLDDPDDPLEAARMVRTSAEDWPGAPTPAALDWTDPSDFPRNALLGLPPDIPLVARLREMDLGAVEARHLAEQEDFPPTIDPRGLQGAAPGLGSTRLRGGEVVRVTHMHPTAREWVIQVPADRVVATIRPPGCPDLEAHGELMSVAFDLRAGSMSLTWSALLEIAARYPDNEFAQIQSRVQFVQ